MSYKRKYKKGARINSLDELYHQELVYFRGWEDRPRHIGFIKSMTFRTVANLLELGLYRAEKIEEEEPEHED